MHWQPAAGMSVSTGSALQNAQKGVDVDDRHWDDAVPRREKKAPSAVQHAYTHCRYEVDDEMAPWHGRHGHVPRASDAQQRLMPSDAHRVRLMLPLNVRKPVIFAS